MAGDGGRREPEEEILPERDGVLPGMIGENEGRECGVEHRHGEVLEAFLENFPDGILLLDLQGSVLECRMGTETTFLEIFRERMTAGQRFSDLPIFSEETVSRAVKAFEKVRCSGFCVHCEFPLELSDRTMFLEMRLFPAGRGHVAVLCRDVTELRLVERDLDLDLAEGIIQNAQEGIVVTDAAGIITMVNHAFTEITGYTPEEALGRRPSILKSKHHGREFYESMWRSLAEKGHWQGEIWNRRKSGEVYPEWLSIGALRDERGVIRHFVSVFSDISQLKAQEMQIAHQAYHDRLTGLPNRHLFRDRLMVEVAQAHREGGSLGVLLLNLDRFKNVNDILGHAAGDGILVAVGERLRGLVKEGDTVSSMGGDEFAVLVPRLVVPGEMGRLAREILASLREPFEVEGQRFYLTASIGISVYPLDGEDQVELVRTADLALRRAKEQGGDGYSFYAESMNQAVSKKLVMENGLRRALEREEFVLYYQPQVEVETGRLIGVEALLRWRNEDGTVISPGEFIPLAEETGLILPIGEWVLHKACRQNRQWRDAGFPPVEISVNISALQVARGNLVSLVAGVLEKTGLEPSGLAVEITENSLMANRDAAREIFRALDDMGVRIYIDDFGTGYSSLGYLKNFALSGFKVDKSFVDGIATCVRDAAILEAMFGMARSLELDVVVEGVENAVQLTVLKSLGCRFVQGFLYSTPLPPEMATLYVKKGFVRPPG